VARGSPLLFVLYYSRMSNRHLARTMAMQCLFEWDFRGKDISRLSNVILHVREEFSGDFDDSGYVQKQVQGVVDNIEEIDETLAHFAPDWKLEDMTATDRNILRLGAFELKIDENIPAKVAINEAIELGKAFGGEASGKFVNGVLGAVYKDMIAKGEIKEVDKQEKKTESVSE